MYVIFELTRYYIMFYLSEMKLRLFIIISCSFTATNAQNIKSIGFKGGINRSNQEWNYNNISVDSKYQARNFGSYFLSADFFAKKYLSVVGDLGYISKGRALTVQITDDVGNYLGFSKFVERFSYLTFNPQIKFHYDIHKFSPYLFGGPHADLFIKHKDHISNLSDNKTYYTNPKGNAIILGITYGVGCEYRQADMVYK